MTRDEGFSLLEMVAVMAIWAVVSILGVQVLAGTIENRGRSVEAVAATADAVAALAVLRRDLKSIAALGSEAAGLPALSVTDREVALLRYAANEGEALERVRWTLDPETQTLQRETGDLGDGATSPVVLLDDVTELDLRVLAPARKWIAGAGWRPSHPGDLPVGFDLRLVSTQLGELRVVVAR